MKFLEKHGARIDAFQQKNDIIGFPVAVVKRYSDDKVSKQAALITYYGFLAIFPLLLIFVTVTNIVANDDPMLKTKITEQLLQYLPVLGSSLQGSVHSLKASGLPLLFEVLVLLYGARGLAISLKEAFSLVWRTEPDHANFFLDNLRNVAMLTAAGVGVIVGTVITYLLSTIFDVSTSSVFLISSVNSLITFGLFLAVFRLGTSSKIKTKYLIVGAVITTVGVLTVQHFGVAIMGQELSRLQGVYGTFSLTLGMMFWLFLQAQIIMYGLVVTAVRAQRDWPKPLFAQEK